MTLRHAALAVAAGAASLATAAAAPPPNIVFLLAESTDGRVFRADSPVPMPNLRELQASGVTFDGTYSNAPVCCPSRASMLSGRAPHNIPHTHHGVHVKGVWNNYEGLDSTYVTLFDLLASGGGYQSLITGKTDWTMGAHSEDAMLEALTHNIAWPYNISANGGWGQEDDMCAAAGQVAKGGSAGASGSSYPADWEGVTAATDFIKAPARKGKPWIAYQGFNIVHPPYATNEYWYGRIDQSKVTVPSWPPLAEMHPCDLQAAMLKGCTPSSVNASAFSDPARVKRIRTIYYAEVAEFDAMLGEYIAAVKASGQWNNTVWVVTADHGDMQLERQMFYKMVPYDASSRGACAASDRRRLAVAAWVHPIVTHQQLVIALSLSFMFSPPPPHARRLQCPSSFPPRAWRRRW